MQITEFDYLIVGAGLMGSSTAMHLAGMLQNKNAAIAVLDADLEGTLSSSELNAGGARGTWDQLVNVQLAKDSIQFFNTHREEVGFHACGYLWMFASNTWAKAQERASKLSGVWDVQVLNVNDLQAKAPFIDKTEGIAGATFSPKDGLFNPNLLKNLFRGEARKNRVEFLDGHRVVEVENLGAKGWAITCEVRSPVETEVREFLAEETNPKPQNSTVKLKTKVLINCAGAWAGRLAQLMGYESPVWAVRRQVSIFSCRELNLRNNGMIIDTSGVYFHPEADNILGGYADPAEPPGHNLKYDGLSFFEEKIWTPLYERSSKFESLKHITGWGGLYEMTPDCSGIIGHAGGLANAFECHGFSGRGAMQSFAAGRGLAELIAFRRFQTLDLASLSGDRFAKNRLVPEGLHI